MTISVVGFAPVPRRMAVGADPTMLRGDDLRLPKRPH